MAASVYRTPNLSRVVCAAFCAQCRLQTRLVMLTRVTQLWHVYALRMFPYSYRYMHPVMFVSTDMVCVILVGYLRILLFLPGAVT